MKQQVINYEFQILHNQLIRSGQSSPAYHSFPYRYSHWKLSTTLHRIVDSIQKELKWIGNSDSSYIIAFFYSLFKICAGKQDILIRLKHSLYKVCQYCLNLSQQKSLVEFVGLLSQQQALISTYLQKNPHIQDLLVKIYQASIPLIKSDSRNGYEMDPFQTLKEYSEVLFTFLKVEPVKHCENALQLRIEETHEQIYILREKGCYFVLENRPKLKKKNKIKSLEHRAPMFDDCVIIDEQEEEDTILRESINLRSPRSSKRSPAKPKSTPHVSSLQQSPVKSQNKKVPTFLNKPKKRQQRSSLNEEEYMKRSKPIPQKQNIFKQTVNKKIVSNFRKEKSPKNIVPSNSINKDIKQSKSKSKSQSPQRHKKSRIVVPYQHLVDEFHQKQKQKMKQSKPTPQSYSNIPPSTRYIQPQSQQLIKTRIKETSQQKNSYKRKFPSSQMTSINTRLSQQHLNSENYIHPPQVKINYPMNVDARISGQLARQSQSPMPVSFNYEYHAAR